MLAIKKLNNNAVLCRDGQGRDVIAMGRGVGFGGNFPASCRSLRLSIRFMTSTPKGRTSCATFLLRS